MSATDDITMEHVSPGMEFGEAVYGPLDREGFARYSEESCVTEQIYHDDE